jgi:hypothetical protein
MKNAKALDMEINLLRKLQEVIIKDREKLSFLLDEDLIDLSTYDISRYRFNAYYDGLTKDIATLSQQLYDLTKPGQQFEDLEKGPLHGPFLAPGYVSSSKNTANNGQH